MGFKKGDKKPASSGRKKGVPNKVTKSVKEVFEHVFNSIQDDPKANLEEWARKNPGQFYPIAAKLIPSELKAKINERIIVVIPPDEKVDDKD